MPSPPLASRVLLIGWDAADWKIISPLMDAGRMPTLSRLVERGVMGNISTLRPVLSPILWNSIATGKRADKHGILGFIEPSPDGAGIRSASSTSRKTKALWNILTQTGRKTHVVGWYASHPAEPINGVYVSNQFAQSMPIDPTKNWPLPTGTVHPTELHNVIASFRVHPEEVTKADLAPMIPRIAEIDIKTDERPGTLAHLVTRGASVHAFATGILQNEPWDFTAIYYETIDLIGHHFMPFHPPRMKSVSERDFELYQHVVAETYVWHDMLLARLVQLAGQDTTIILVSDHGFHCDHLRPASGDAVAPHEAASWHRHHGIFVMAGPNILKDERIYGATLLDVAPTVLALFGLPIGADMDGKVLAQAFDRPVAIDRIPSWDEVPGEAGMHPSDVRVDPIDASEAMRQLVELGYMPAPTGEQNSAVEIATREWKYNLAATQFDAGRAADALPLIESLYRGDPKNARFTILLAQCYAHLNRPGDVRRVIDALNTNHPATPEADLWLGWALMVSGEPEAAIKHLLRAEQSSPDSPVVHTMIGRIYCQQRRWGDAERAFARALEIDPDSELAHDGMASVMLGTGRDEEAAAHALRAVGLLHDLPTAHYHLGVALVRLGRYERAATAMSVAVSMAPGMLHAHRYLVALYMKLNNPEKAMAHRKIARQLWDSIPKKEKEGPAAPPRDA